MNEPNKPMPPAAAALVALCALFAVTGLGVGLRNVLSATDVVLLYVGGVVAMGFLGSWRTSLFVAFASVGLFNFFFVTPFYTLQISDPRYLLTFAVMAATGVVVSALMNRVQTLRRRAEDRANALSGLYGLASALVKAPDEEGISTALRTEAPRVLGQPVRLAPGATEGEWSIKLPTLERDMVLAGARVTQAVPAADAADAVALLASSALQRVELQDRVRTVQVAAESEHLRNAMLSSVSHDLRTPLASIVGAATTLLNDSKLSTTEREELTRSIETQGWRLARQLENLLQMTRVDAGGFELRREWVPPEEIIGSALASLGSITDEVEVVDSGPELVDVDAVAVGVVLTNLLANALSHSKEVRLESGVDDGEWVLRVLDRGPGFPDDELPRVFEKFFRGAASSVGTGLGLAIVEAITRAHGGRTWARNRPTGGAEVGFAIPMGELPLLAPEALLVLEAKTQ